MIALVCLQQAVRSENYRQGRAGERVEKMVKIKIYGY